MIVTSLSVIVCVYNTKKRLLSECLSSLRASSVGDSLEILMVDDGSEENYGDLVRRHRVNYHRTENRGQLAARLYGISAARGDYIAFVDSDDTVSLNYHLPMQMAAEAKDADIVLGGWAFLTERARRVCIDDTCMSHRILAEGDLTLALYTSQRGREHSYYVTWNKLYRRELLLKCREELYRLGLSKIRLTYSEDVLLNFFAFKFADRVTNVRSGFYFYRIHRDQSVNINGQRKLLEQIVSINISLGIMRDNVGDNIYSSKIREDLEAWSRLMARSHYTAARTAGYIELYGIIKEKYGVKKNRRASLSDGAVYARGELLGENFSEIDRALGEIYFVKEDITAKYERRARCISRIIEDMPHGVCFSRRGEYSVPRRKISLKARLIHSPIMYKIGMLLFRKGSRAREFLKRRL